MRADLAALLHHADGRVWRNLLEPDGGGEARGSGADHHDVELHRLARSSLGHAFPPDTDRDGRRWHVMKRRGVAQNPPPRTAGASGTVRSRMAVARRRPSGQRHATWTRSRHCGCRSSGEPTRRWAKRRVDRMAARPPAPVAVLPAPATRCPSSNQRAGRAGGRPSPCHRRCGPCSRCVLPRSRRRCTTLDELRAALAAFDGCALVGDRHQSGLRRRQSAIRPDVRRRRSRRGGGPGRQAVRRPVGPVPRPDAREHRPGPDATA